MENTDKDSYEIPITHGHEYLHLYEVPTGMYEYAYPEGPNHPPDLPPARAETTPSKPPAAHMTAASGNKYEGRRYAFRNLYCKKRTCVVFLIVLVTLVIAVNTVGIVCGKTDFCKGQAAPSTTIDTKSTEPRRTRYSECFGNPLMYKGKLCASTTRHDSYSKVSDRGACGCGPSNPDRPYNWSLTVYTSSINQAYFDTNGTTWCGESCGICFRLETTGGFVEGQGQPTAPSQTYVFLIVNVCNDYRWCGQKTRTDVNLYGYVAHFNLENGNAQIDHLGWDNPEVTFEIVDCDFAQNSKTPSRDVYKNECECGSPSQYLVPKS